MTAPDTIEVTTIDDPVPRPDDVIIEVAAVGLCGTDLQILAGEHGVLPVVPGHEVTGTVVATGGAVEDLRIGDRVAVDPSLPCRACRFCRRGRENLCSTLGALGVTTAGGAAEYLRADADRCIVLPDHVDLHGATLIEPLSCVLHGYDVLGPTLGASVLIYGAGTMGLLMLEMAKHTGPRSVHVVDPNGERQRRAVSFGCTAAGPGVDDFDAADGWDVVVDASGNSDAIQDGIGRVARGGTFLQFGVATPSARVSISPYEIYHHEITIRGSMAVLNSFERAADLFATGVIDWRAFVTSQRPLSEYAEALDSFRRGAGVKTQVLPGGLQKAPS